MNPEQQPVLGPAQWGQLIDRALRKLREQGTLPDSPCARMQGRMLFCAGALIVRSAIAVLKSEAAARAFERALVRTGDKGLIVAAARAVGFPVAVAEQAVVSNDATPQTHRVEQLARFIESLRTSAPRLAG